MPPQRKSTTTFEKLLTSQSGSLKKIREKKGLSQDYMAYQLNITQPHYQKLESGKLRMKVDVYFKILELLDIEVIFRERS